MSLDKTYPSYKGYHYKNFKRFSEFKVLKELGKGGYSTVYLVEHKKTKIKYALKCAYKVKRVGGQDRDRSARTRTEIEVLDYLDHPNIVKLEGWFEDDDNIYLVLEHLRGKDLSNFFKKDLPTHKDAIKVIKQVVEALKYCHNKGVIHRDIKLDNILIDKTLTIKITDFGLCTVRRSAKEIHYSQVGTVRYTAPEIIAEEGYNHLVDIWCLGIVIFMLLTGRYPFDGSNRKKVFRRILNKEIKWENYDLSEYAIDLLENILIKDPSYRLSLDQILEHPWITIHE